ncbi:MAG: guanylate kinase [bacterium]|nr:guanylate kinase [bacterium]
MLEGKLIVISGPSGVGKGTIVRKLLAHDENFCLSISATTRKKRLGEVAGKDYYFFTKAQFEEFIEENKFAEYAKYAGHYYGTLCSTINRELIKGKYLLLEIDVQGAFQIKEKYPDAKLIFVLPPNLSELKNRLTDRNTETPEAIKKRLSQVDREISCAKYFDTKVVNDDVELATLAVLEAIYS